MEKDDYESENSKLRELYLARQKRSKKQQQPQELISEATKTIRTIQEPPKVVQISLINSIRVNYVIQDQRPVHAKAHCITLANLLHENMQIYQRQPISSEVLSIMITTYGFEWEVFAPIAQSGKPIFIFNRSDDATNSIERGYNGKDNVVIVSPPKSNTGYGVFHPKLWLVKFKKFLRVIVGTGNNHLCDWTVWQNAWWYHDCPLKSKEENNSKQSNQKQPNEEKEWGVVKNFDYAKDFIATLKWAIAEMQPKGFNVLDQMQIKIDDYSFEGIKAILIPTLPGRFKGDEMEKVGLAKVRSIMKRHQKQFKNPMLTCNSTSLGQVNEKLLQQVYNSFNPHASFFKITNFRLIYPTSDYIYKETCGRAEVLFLTQENYKKSGIKKEVFYRYQNAENGVKGSIPHLKTIIIEQQGEKERCVLFLGSHNLTRAAWGTYEKGQTQISCNNSELGVLILDYSLQDLKKWLPYRLPPTPYSPTDQPFLRVQ